MANLAFVIFVAVAVACVQARPQQKQDWHVGADSVRPSGVNVHGHANVPLHQGQNSRTDGVVHGSRVIGGPYNGQGSVGGGVQWEHRGGWKAGADVTHQRHGDTRYGVSVSKTF